MLTTGPHTQISQTGRNGLQSKQLAELVMNTFGHFLMKINCKCAAEASQDKSGENAGQQCRKI